MVLLLVYGECTLNDGGECDGYSFDKLQVRMRCGPVECDGDLIVILRMTLERISADISQ